MHVRSGARLLSTIFLLLAAVHLLNAFGFVSGYPGSPISSAVIFLIICTLVYGVFAERRYFLIPFLAAKAFLTLATVSSFLIWVALHVAYRDKVSEHTKGSLLSYMDIVESQNKKPNMLVCIGLGFITIACLQMYILKVFLNFYCFLRERHQPLLTDTAHSSRYSPISTTSSSLYQN
ncbi:hypothetical protein RB195_003021 [Necator americanus]